MRIAFFDITESWQEEYLRKHLPTEELAFFTFPLNAQTVSQAEGADVVSIFISSQVDAAVIEQLPARLVSTRSTGFDHIDLNSARAKGIQVSNVPFYGENTVAEHTIALLLALSRRIPESIARVKIGDFTYQGLRGWDLKGRKLGIIGGGHIGLHVARIAKGFELEVFVFDLKHDPKLADQIGFEYVPLERLLSLADIISLHLPLNNQTEHILAQREFAQMKKGVYLINTARGGLIDTDALVEALKSGKVAGAALDVLEEEEALNDELELVTTSSVPKDKLRTLLQEHVLIEMPNVIITPHNAFNSQEAIIRILDTTVANIVSFKHGSSQNLVT